jgi:hypothetical protein
MALEYVYRALVGAQYTGTQATADILAACAQISQLTGNQWSVQSDNGQTLVLRETNPVNGAYADWPVLAGQVVVIDPSVGIVDRLPVDKWQARYQRENDILDKALVRGLNSAQWIAALKTKLGIPAAAK